MRTVYLLCTVSQDDLLCQQVFIEPQSYGANLLEQNFLWTPPRNCGKGWLWREDRQQQWSLPDTYTLSPRHTSPLILTIYKQGHMTAQAQIRYIPEALSGRDEEDHCIPWRSTQGAIPNQAVPLSYTLIETKRRLLKDFTDVTSE